MTVKEKARSLGFQLVGVAPTGPSPESLFYPEWLARGYAGEMQYLEKQSTGRMDPQTILPGARSVIVCAMNYNTDRPLTAYDSLRAWISRYAWGDDYHEVLSGKLRVRSHRPPCTRLRRRRRTETRPPLASERPQTSHAGGLAGTRRWLSQAVRTVAGMQLQPTNIALVTGTLSRRTEPAGSAIRWVRRRTRRHRPRGGPADHLRSRQLARRSGPCARVANRNRSRRAGSRAPALLPFCRHDCEPHRSRRRGRRHGPTVGKGRVDARRGPSAPALKLAVYG